ncbi:MAG: hypothetical protein C5B43_04850, partial [Verrucomicrobia bacterium]
MNANSINLTPKSTIPNNNSAIINTNQNVEQEIGQRRPLELLFSENTNKKALTSRQMSEDKKRQYNEIVALYINKSIDIVVEFAKSELGPKYEFPRNEKMSTLLLLEKQAELENFILSQGDEMTTEKYKKYSNKYKMHSNDDKYASSPFNDLFNSLKSTYSEELVDDVFTSMIIYKIFCGAHFSFDEDRKRVMHLNFDHNKEKRSIPKLEMQIKEAHIKSKKFIEQKYYYWIKMILNPHMDNYEKGGKFAEYFGEKVNPSTDQDHFFNQEPNKCSKIIGKIACYAIKLQIFIDVLSQAERSSKTLENLKILAEECQTCSNFYNKDLQYYDDCQDARLPKIAFIVDYFEVKNYLNSLCKIFKQILHTESKKSSYNQPIKVNKPNNQKQEKTKAIAQEKGSILNNLEEKIIINEKDVVDNIIDEESDLEEIQEEVSDLMESVMRMIDQDRKRKMELKEAKALAALLTKNNLKTVNTNEE